MIPRAGFRNRAVMVVPLLALLGCVSTSKRAVSDAGNTSLETGKALSMDVAPDGELSMRCYRTAAGCICKMQLTGEVGTCSATDLTGAAPAEDKVLCCALGATLCSCQQYGCRDFPSLQSCTCQLSVDDGTAAVVSCPARTGVTCCMDTVSAIRRCACTPSACASGQQTVSSCSVADVAVCATGGVETTTCK